MSKGLHPWHFGVLAVVVVALVALAVPGTAHVPSSDRAAAVHAARADHEVRADLREHRGASVQVRRFDSGALRVSFLDGDLLLAEAVVRDGDHRVTAVKGESGNYGSVDGWAQSPIAWVVFAAVAAFALVAGRRGNGRRWLAWLALLVPMLTAAWWNHDRPITGTLLGYPALALVVVLAFLPAARAPRRRRDVRRQFAPAWQSRKVWAAIALLLVLVDVSVATTQAVATDVGYANMAGATAMLDGHAPYGHVAREIVHGDTYPPLSYLVYVPAALVWPVHDLFDSVSGALAVGALAFLVCVGALWRLGGPRLVVAFAALPLTPIAVGSGTNDIVVAAFVSLALLAARRPAVGAALLAAAAWTKAAPVVLLPAWIWRAGRSPKAALRALLGVAVTTLVAVVPIVALGGGHALHLMVRAIAFQAERGTLLSLWAQLDSRAAQLTAEAIAVVAILVLLRRAMATGADRLAPLAATTAGCLALTQLVANYWTPLYAMWFVPALLVAVDPGRSPRERSSEAPTD